MQAAMPNGITVEVDQMQNPFVDELLVEPLVVQEGQLALGHAPGLGIALNLDKVEQLRMADPLSVPAGVYSDMMFGRQNFPTALPYVVMDLEMD